jgi:electron transfer flavoprotein alpha subunit
MSFLVFSEDKELAFQLLGKSRELANSSGAEVHALSISSPMEYIKQGADKAFKIDSKGLNIEGLRNALLSAVEISRAEILMIGATKTGKELAPRVAASLNIGCMSECIDVSLEKGTLVIKRLTYGGSTIARETSHSKPTVITIPPRSFDKLEPNERVGEVIDLQFNIPSSRVKVLERKEKPKREADLENADIIISAGRGFKDKEDLKLLHELAEVLGAQVGCTRPISADLGWMDDWVGISGKKVKPKLYIACGISGTIQHKAGIRESKIIISINNDEAAGIHRISDYSIVGDIYKVLPELLQAIKERV